MVNSSSGPPMHRLGRDVLGAYAAQDELAQALARYRRPGDEALTCQRWLDETPAKRYAAHRLYGDLLTREGLRVLDVGGGLTTLTRALAERHHLTLVDVLAHDGEAAAAFQEGAAAFDLVRKDWHEAIAGGPWDVVVAADLFPNVDQRLAMFLEHVLPLTREARLSLTYYNQPRFYLTRRIGADEVLCMLAWDGQQTARALERFLARIDRPDLGVLEATSDSVYANGRQVCLLRVWGDLDR